jgi:hypothetical protein
MCSLPSYTETRTGDADCLFFFIICFLSIQALVSAGITGRRGPQVAFRACASRRFRLFQTVFIRCDGVTKPTPFREAAGAADN